MNFKHQRQRRGQLTACIGVGSVHLLRLHGSSFGFLARFGLLVCRRTGRLRGGRSGCLGLLLVAR